MAQRSWKTDLKHKQNCNSLSTLSTERSKKAFVHISPQIQQWPQKVEAWERSLKHHHQAPPRLRGHSRNSVAVVAAKKPRNLNTVLNPSDHEDCQNTWERVWPAARPLGRSALPMEYLFLILASSGWAWTRALANRSPVVMDSMAVHGKGRWPGPSCSQDPWGRATKQPNPIQTSQPQPQGAG